MYRIYRYIHDAWALGALAAIPKDDPVLLVGAGLTMVDVAVTLHDRGHTGVIHAVSRRGIAPLAHASHGGEPYPALLAPDRSVATARTLMRQVRVEVRQAALRGHDWRSVLDALRPGTQALWRNLPRDEQRRFLRHVQPYWDAHRHRIAPGVATTLAAMTAHRQLVVRAGRGRSYREQPDGIDATIRYRGEAADTVVRVGTVINCTGASVDLRRDRSPLMEHLFAQGFIRPDSLGLGLCNDEHGAICDAEGWPSRVLYTLGVLRKGALWETTAIPEIRAQAATLAAHLLDQEQ